MSEMATDSDALSKMTTTQTLEQILTSASPSPHAPPQPITLPIVLVEEILQWLPVKSLIRLKSVSKSWNSLISRPRFAKKQLRLSPPATCLFLSIMNRSREFIPRSLPLPSVFNNAVTAVSASEHRYPLKNQKRNRLMVGSCDGILCFAVNQLASRLLLLLWNPSIGKYKKLPRLDMSEGCYSIYGFGYDSFADKYKVVAVLFHGGDSSSSTASFRVKTEVMVFTLGTHSWEMIPDFPSVIPLDVSGKFVSGTINWFAFNGSCARVIVSLDLQKETYEEVLQPDYGGVAVSECTLGVLRDCLCILCHSDTFLDVWLMKDYGKKESWTKLFRVPYMGNSRSFPSTRALCISEDDQVLLKLQSELVVYDPRNGTFRTPQVEDIKKSKTSAVYVQSLISPC